MYPIINQYPKHLLPIANKPLMGYVLENLEKYNAFGKCSTETSPFSSDNFLILHVNH